MTLADFLDRLRKVKDEYDWRRYGGPIRGFRRIDSDLFLNLEFCPITAVVCSEAKETYSQTWYRFAAQRIGMDDGLAGDVAASADSIDGPCRKELLDVLFPGGEVGC